MKRSDYFLILVLAVLGIAFRLLPHPPNFTPLAAISLFAGFYFRRIGLAVLPTLAAMLVTDAAIGFYDPRILVTVYGGILLPTALGPLLRRQMNPASVIIASFAGSVLFYGSTNLAVWAFSGMYQASWQGLVACYVTALPFFKLTLAGDVFWATILFGAYGLRNVIVARLRPVAEIRSQGVGHAI